MPTRVLLWDQREIIRAGIKSICCQREDLQLVGETSKQDSAIALAQTHRPDVIVVEMALLKAGAHDVFECLSATNPRCETKILVLAEENRLDVAARMTQAGASGYLTHHSSLEEIAVAIQCIAKGRIFISHSHGVMSGPKSRQSQLPSPGSQPASEPDSTLLDSRLRPTIQTNAKSVKRRLDLSAREREVLALIAEGMTNKQAAESIFLSVKTVETYRSRIMKKHGLKDRLALVKFAASIATTQEELSEQS